MARVYHSICCPRFPQSVSFLFQQGRHRRTLSTSCLAFRPSKYSTVLAMSSEPGMMAPPASSSSAGCIERRTVRGILVSARRLNKGLTFLNVRPSPSDADSTTVACGERDGVAQSSPAPEDDLQVVVWGKLARLLPGSVLEATGVEETATKEENPEAIPGSLLVKCAEDVRVLATPEDQPPQQLVDDDDLQTWSAQSDLYRGGASSSLPAWTTSSKNAAKNIPATEPLLEEHRTQHPTVPSASSTASSSAASLRPEKHFTPQTPRFHLTPNNVRWGSTLRRLNLGAYNKLNYPVDRDDVPGVGSPSPPPTPAPLVVGCSPPPTTRRSLSRGTSTSSVRQAGGFSPPRCFWCPSWGTRRRCSITPRSWACWTTSRAATGTSRSS